MAAAALLSCKSGPKAIDQNQSSDGQPITRAVFAEDRLWMLHYSGRLVSVAPSDAKPEGVRAPGKIVDICRSTGRLTAIVDDGRGRWTIASYAGRSWTVGVSMQTMGDLQLALSCRHDNNAITVVTNRRIIEVERNDIRSIKLQKELQRPEGVTTALAVRGAVWVGYNVGEWGGGLLRIGRSDGTVTKVERRSGDLCGGPLNADCDPVNGIVEAPEDGTCVVAAIGLVHFLSHGRIVQVCGDKVRRLYFKPLDPQPPRGELNDGEPSSTVAFYGLALHGDAIWAVGIDGLYRFTEGQAAQFQPLPAFQNKGGYRVSFAVPGIALVMTDINQRSSLSGAVPIMVIR